MANKNKPINSKMYVELNKRIWLIKDREGKIIDSFRQKMLAEKWKRKLEKERFEDLFVERDNSYREIIKKAIK